MTKTTVQLRIRKIAAVVRRIIGVPDYDLYLAHAGRCHPGEPTMTREEFINERLKDKYSRPGNRCC
jgi:uncharacterized short protein YbdD (DUF466 family)